MNPLTYSAMVHQIVVQNVTLQRITLLLESVACSRPMCRGPMFGFEMILIFRIETQKFDMCGGFHFPTVSPQSAPNPSSILPFVETVYFLQRKSRNLYCGREKVTFCNKIRLNLWLLRPLTTKNVSYYLNLILLSQ